MLAFNFQSQAQTVPQQNKRMIKADLNQDGVLDKSEYDQRFTKKVNAQQLRADQTFAKADINNDNVLDREELKKMHTKRRAVIERKKARNMHNKKAPIAQKRKLQARRSLRNMDTNGDKQIDRKEFANSRRNSAIKKSNIKRAFNRIDSDQNGLLSPQELRQARAKRKHHKTN